MHIVIEAYRESPPSSYEVAIFDVYFPDMEMTFKKMKLVKSKKGHYFINPPSFCTDDGAGNKTWTPYFCFSETMGKQFKNAVMQELKVFVPEIH